MWKEIQNTKSHMTSRNVLNGPRREKTCLRGFANKKGADQPAHPRSLISAFVIRLLQSVIYRLATSEISIRYLISVAEETCLKLALSETPKTGFLAMRPINVSEYFHMDQEMQQSHTTD